MHAVSLVPNRQHVFFTAVDRATYRRLLVALPEEARVRVLGYSLMMNHVHLGLVPEREDSL